MRRLVASTLILTLLTMICAPTASGQEIGEVDAPKHEKTVVAPVIGEDASALSCLAKGKYDARALAPVSDPDLGHFRQPRRAICPRPSRQAFCAHLTKASLRMNDSHSKA